LNYQPLYISNMRFIVIPLALLSLVFSSCFKDLDSLIAEEEAAALQNSINDIKKLVVGTGMSGIYRHHANKL
jgi:hypothetical protein